VASWEVGDDADGPRRADGEALPLGIFAERATPDAELDTEQTDIPTLLDRNFGCYIERDTDTLLF